MNKPERDPHVEELVALLALGLLSPAEQEELLRKDVGWDDDMERMLVEYDETTALLAYDAPAVAPPPGLKQQIMSKLPARKAASKVIPFPIWVPYALAACFVFLIAFQSWRIHALNGSLTEAQRALQEVELQKADDAERQALADFHVHLLPAKDATYGAAQIAVGWNSHLHQGIVTLQNLPPPPAGHDYQLWVLDPKAAAPISAGLVRTENGSQTFAVATTAAAGPGFAISLEPGGGSVEPVGPILFALAPVE